MSMLNMELHQAYESLHHEESVVNDADDDDEDDPMYQELLDTNDLVTAQLVSAGPAGLAAAAAIASGKKRRNHSFESNPCIRKRQQTRLMRKLYSLMEEYIVRVGQQAVIICCSPGKDTQSSSFRVFGSQPLECVIKNRKWTILQNLEKSLISQKHQATTENVGQFELPPLTVDGTPIGLDRMTQAQLRNFVPEMLKHSTGKSKPGWGKEDCRPIWWPPDVPWANVRSDSRREEIKQTVPWTLALRKIVRSCYEYHNRQDLLIDPFFKTEHPQHQSIQHHPVSGVGNLKHGCLVQPITNPDGTIKLVQLNTDNFIKDDDDNLNSESIKKEPNQDDQSITTPPKKILKLSRSVYESIMSQLNDASMRTSSSSSLGCVQSIPLQQSNILNCSPLENPSMDSSMQTFKIEINEDYSGSSL